MERTIQPGMQPPETGRCTRPNITSLDLFGLNLINKNRNASTVEVSSLPEIPRDDGKRLFLEQKQVMVGTGLLGNGLFAAEGIGKDDVVIEFKEERDSTEEGNRR